MDISTLQGFVEDAWEQQVLPALADYIRIPNRSPHFDPQWAESGHMDRAVSLAAEWCRANAPPGLTLEIIRLPGRTPLLYLESPGASEHTVLLYGHLDKQPEMVGWRQGLGPWTPVREGERLYGRGGADDGYAVFACLVALGALAAQQVAHGRCVALIETCEESGSYDLPAYLETLAGRIGSPDLVVCLDSGCGNYDQLWCTTSLRGIAAGTLTVEVLREGVHSGDAGGVVPSSFRVLRQLLGRIEDSETGAILLADFYAPIPMERIAQAQTAADVLGESIVERYPWVDGAVAVREDFVELVLNRTWRPALTSTGIDGMPPIAAAGNVLRPFTRLKLSMRCPPTCDAAHLTERLREVLESDPPYGSRVRFEPDQAASGWNAPPMQPWLVEAVEEASERCFGRPAMYMGEGGTIPFMRMLAERYPLAQFLITGVLGPQANAHGPNEFLHIPTAKKLSAGVALILARHYAHRERDAARRA